MNKNISVTQTEHTARRDGLKSKVMTGDYVIVSKMMGITTDNVRIRFHRAKKDVVDAVELLINNREKLIEKYQNQ